MDIRWCAPLFGRAYAVDNAKKRRTSRPKIQVITINASSISRFVAARGPGDWRREQEMERQSPAQPASYIDPSADQYAGISCTHKAVRAKLTQ